MTSSARKRVGEVLGTFMERITRRAVVNDRNLAQIRLNLAQVLHVRTVAVGAVLPVEPAGKILAFQLEPVNDRIRVFLHRGGEDDQVVPLADLSMKYQRHCADS